MSVCQINNQDKFRSSHFRYLGLITHEDFEIEEDVIYRIKARLLKW